MNTEWILVVKPPPGTELQVYEKPSFVKPTPLQTLKRLVLYAQKCKHVVTVVLSAVH